MWSLSLWNQGYFCYLGQWILLLNLIKELDHGSQDSWWMILIKIDKLITSFVSHNIQELLLEPILQQMSSSLINFIDGLIRMSFLIFFYQLTSDLIIRYHGVLDIFILFKILDQDFIMQCALANSWKT